MKNMNKGGKSKVGEISTPAAIYTLKNRGETRAIDSNTK
jgi:hypothetical protein